MNHLVLAALALATSAAHARPPRAARLASCVTPAARVYAARLTGDQLTLCFERGGPRSCWQRDVRAAPDVAWTPAPATAIAAIGPCGSMLCPPRDPPATARLTLATRVRVCAPDGADCRTVITPPAPPVPDGDLAVVASADRGLLAVTLDDARVTVVDVASARVLATTAPWPVPDTGLGWARPRIRFAGDRLVLVRTDGVRSRGRLVDPRTGATLAALADDHHLDQASPVSVGAHLAVATADGEALALHDGTTGKRTATIALFGAPRGAAATLALLAASADQRAVIAVRGEGDGAVKQVDVATGGVTTTPRPPACP